MKKSPAFTLIETLVTLAIITIILGFAVMGVQGLRNQGLKTGDEAAVKTLNEASIRASIKDISGPGTTGTDKTAALNWYLDQNLIGNIKTPDISNLSYALGIWSNPPWKSFEAFYEEYKQLDENIIGIAIADANGLSTLHNVALSKGYSNVTNMLAGLGYSSITEMAEATGVSTLDPELVAANPEALGYLLANFDQFDTNQKIGHIRSFTPISGDSPLDENQCLTLYQKATADPALSSEYPDMVSVMTTQYEGGYGPVDVSTLDLSTIANPPFIDYTKTNVTVAQLNNRPSNGSMAGNYSNLDLTGINLTGKILDNANFSNVTGINGSNLNQAAEIYNSNLSGLDLTGLNLASKNAGFIDFSNATGITGAAFNNAMTIANSKMDGIDMTGFVPTGIFSNGLSVSGTDFSNAVNFTGAMINNANSSKTSMNLSGVDMTGAVFDGNTLSYSNFSGSNITIQQLINVSRMIDLDLRGTGITQAALESAMLAAGKSISNRNVKTSTFLYGP